MGLKEKIQADLEKALKSGKPFEAGVLRMTGAAIHNREIEKRAKVFRQKPELKVQDLAEKSKLTDEEIVEVISSEAKKRRDAASEFEKGGRQDLVEKEKKELGLLQKYLPEQLSEEDLKRLAKKTIEKVEAKEVKDIGKVMAELMPKVKGKAEGGIVSKIVKELLTPRVE